MKNSIIILFLVLAFSGVSQEKAKDKKKDKPDKLKVFMNFSGNKSFLKNETKYWSFSFGLKSKCKYKLGFNYTWLRGNYKTDNYPVSLIDYPNAQPTTRTDIKFYSVMFEPILLKGKRVNVSSPFNIGITELISDYKVGAANFENYHESNPLFLSAALDFDFRILAIMKIGFSLGYRHLLSDLPVATDTFSTPYYGFGVKIGGMCK